MEKVIALNKEIEVFYEKLAKIKGKTPADEGRRAAIEDDIARLELRRKKETGALENRSNLEAQWND